MKTKIAAAGLPRLVGLVEGPRLPHHERHEIGVPHTSHDDGFLLHHMFKRAWQRSMRAIHISNRAKHGHEGATCTYNTCNCVITLAGSSKSAAPAVSSSICRSTFTAT